MPRRLCAVPGCPVELVQAGRLMCAEHWERLPGELRAKVAGKWAAFRESLQWKAATTERRLQLTEAFRAALDEALAYLSDGGDHARTA